MEKINKTATFYKDGKYEIEVVEFINEFGYNEVWAFISAPDLDLIEKEFFFAHTTEHHTREELLSMIEKELPGWKLFYLEDMREKEMEN